MWTHEYQTQDEDGNTETWMFYYRRFNARHLVEFQDLMTAHEDNSTVETLTKTATLCLRKAERNGVLMGTDYLDWPMDVLNSVVENHNSFRKEPSE